MRRFHKLSEKLLLTFLFVFSLILIGNTKVLGYDWAVDPTDQFNAYFGRSVSSGDINGDGYDDIIAGAKSWTGDSVNEGRVYVYYGSNSGLGTVPLQIANPVSQVGACFGYSISSGDVNGDSYDDVIIGVPYWDGDTTNEGRVYVYYGDSSGLDTFPSWTVNPTNQHYSKFGTSVSSGDINGDSYDDVIIGANSYDADSDSEGRVYVYFGSSSGLDTIPSWTADPTNQYGAHFGYSVSSGDVNGDSYDDVIIGAPHWSSSDSSEGRVYVYFGGSSGLGTIPSWMVDPTNQAWAYFGYSVSSGDVNGDSYNDVIIGVISWDGDTTDEGRVYVYYGNSSGLNAVPWIVDPTNEYWSFFGYSVSSGDVNGDSYDDVIIGASKCNGGKGRVYVYRGSGDGLDTIPSLTANPTNQIGTGFGHAISSGNVNGDGYDDIIIGASGWDGEEGNEGRVYCYYGPLLGVEEHKAQVTRHKLQVEVYPNPFFEQTVIRYSSFGNRTIHDLRFTIHDVMGRLVEERRVGLEDSKLKIQDYKIGKNLCAGVYFVKVKGYEPTKIIKLR